MLAVLVANPGLSLSPVIMDLDFGALKITL
jgi:hypothetical protein